jgi:hypothetical protein
MNRQPTRRGYFLAGLAGVCVGVLLAGSVLWAFVSAEAATGDPMTLGRTNLAGRATKLRSRAPSTLKLVNTRNTGVPLDLVAEPGQPPLKVNRTTRVANLNADLVDGQHANQLIRVAHAETDDAANVNGNIVTTTITAPKPGFLVMSGSVEAHTDGAGTNDTFGCWLTVNTAAGVGTGRFVRVHTAGITHTSNTEENCSTTQTRVVSAGTHTVALTITSRDTAVFDGAAVWALYVPYDGSGYAPFAVVEGD